eukprot:IDg5711t1
MRASFLRASSFSRASHRALPHPWSVGRGVSACDFVRVNVSGLYFGCVLRTSHISL